MIPSKSLPVLLALLASANGPRIAAQAPAGNQAPRVTITSPVDRGAVATRERFRFQAKALDPDGAVVAVRFILNEGSPILAHAGEDWYADLLAVPPGVHTLRAVATDDQGAEGSSETIRFSTHFRPSLTLQGRRLAAGSPTVELLATAADPDGQVDQVIFSVRGTEIGRVATPPYRLEVAVPAGEVRAFEAVAVDDTGIESRRAGAVVFVDASPLAGDNFQNRSHLSGDDLDLRADNRGATREPGEPEHGGVPGGHSLWWEWWPPVDTAGTLVVDSTGSSFDSVVALYTGTSFNTLRFGSRVEPAPRAKMHVAKTTHNRIVIAVDGRNGSTGDVRLRLRFHPETVVNPIPNDPFEGRIQLRGNAGRTFGLNLGARAELNEPWHGGHPPMRTLWWTWIGRQDGVLELSTEGSRFDTVLGVYTGGPTVTNLAAVASNDDAGGGELHSRVRLQVNAGVAYHVAVGAADPLSSHLELAHRFTPHLTARLGREPDGSLVLSAHTGAPGAWRIEASENLDGWTLQRAVESADGLIRWTVPSPGDTPASRFFRLVQP